MHEDVWKVRKPSKFNKAHYNIYQIYALGPLSKGNQASHPKFERPNGKTQNPKKIWNRSSFDKGQFTLGCPKRHEFERIDVF